MNILILNWRDPVNPFAGGAEKITSKYAQFWVSQGHAVHWISNIFPSSKAEEDYYGIKIYRVGPFFFGNLFELCLKYPFYLINTLLKAWQIIKNKRVNVVVDEIHGLPFFSPLYFGGRKILLVCEVADEIWKKMFPFPVNVLGRLLEKAIYSLYLQSDIWAISKSTRADVLKLNDKLNVKILPLGIDKLKSLPNVKKTSFPSAIFLARIVKMKGAESVLNACSEIVKKFPKFILYMVGTGSPEYINNLKLRAKELKLEKSVQFLGKVSEDKKIELLSQAHFLIHPSFKEGFGLTVLEAGLCFTPTIGRLGSSLDELISNNFDGLLFSEDAQISKLFLQYYNSQEYKKMSKSINIKAKKYTWDQILPSSSVITLI